MIVMIYYIDAYNRQNVALKMKKNILLNFIIIAFSAISCSNLNQAEYKFVGEYHYEIINDSLFNNTYLTEDSFGYLIGDLENNNLNNQTELLKIRPDADCVHEDGFYFFDIHILFL